MKKIALSALCVLLLSIIWSSASSQPQIKPPGNVKLADLRWRDICIYPDPVTKTYYMVGPGRRGVRCYSSKDLLNWVGPEQIYEAPQDVWGLIPIVSIWA